MIYKVISNVYNLCTYIPLLKDKYNIFFNNNNLFLAPISCDGKEKKELLKIFKNKKSQHFFLVEIDESNLTYEPTIVKQWCKEQYVRLDLQRFEIEQEQKIQEVITYIDELTKSLERKEDDFDE